MTISKAHLIDVGGYFWQSLTFQRKGTLTEGKLNTYFLSGMLIRFGSNWGITRRYYAGITLSINHRNTFPLFEVFHAIWIASFGMVFSTGKLISMPCSSLS